MKKLTTLLVFAAFFQNVNAQYAGGGTMRGENGIIPTVLDNVHTGNNELLVSMAGHICVDNTTTNLLGANAVFTGGWQDTIDYGTITISVSSDKASAINGLVIQWSQNSNAVADVDVFNILANEPKSFTFGPNDRYVRIIYTNGAQAQTKFFLSTALRRVYTKPSSHRINDIIVGQDDAELVKAILTGENPAGTFVNFKSTTAGNFKVSLEEFEDTFNTQPLPVQFRGTEYVSGISGVDAITEAQYTLDYVHHEAHAGSYYGYCENVNLGNAAVRDILISVPDTNRWPHLLWKVRSSGEANLTIYEGATTSNDGTGVTEINHNRNSTNTSLTQIFFTPTLTATGAVICLEHFGAGQNAGGESRGEQELILKQNTKYLFRIVSEAADNDISTMFGWYEHANKN